MISYKISNAIVVPINLQKGESALVFKSRTVFIGIDVHRKSYSISCICEGVVVKRLRMTAEPEVLIQLIKDSFPEANIKSAYESGFSGFALHRKLFASGINNIVIHAASLAMRVSDRVKTDAKDSKKLAEQLAAGMLKGIRIPSEEQEFSRLYTRTRSQLIKMRSRTMLQIRMRLLQFGLMPIDYDRPLNRAFVRKILPTLPLKLKISIEIHLANWEHIQLQILKVEKLIKEQNKDNPIVSFYRKVSGLGSVTAGSLVAELGDLLQFKNERALFSFIGLTPREYSSGERKRLGSISKKGNPAVRHMLIQLAWRAIKKDPKLNEKFTALAGRIGKRKAIVAIARKLIGIIRATIRNNTEYQVNYRATGK